MASGLQCAKHKILFTNHLKALCFLMKMPCLDLMVAEMDIHSILLQCVTPSVVSADDVKEVPCQQRVSKSEKRVVC